MSTENTQDKTATEGCAPAAGYAPEPRTTLIRLVVIDQTVPTAGLNTTDS